LLNEIISLDIRPTLYPPQDIFTSSSVEGISIGKAFGGQHLIVKKEPYYYFQNLYPLIQYDSSSRDYPLLEFKIETAPVENFYRRIRIIRVLEDVSGMLNDLSSEQMKTFEETVKRRAFF